MPARTRVLGAWLQAGAQNTSVSVYDAMGAVNLKFTLNALANTCSPYMDFGSAGILFRDGVYAVIANEGDVLHVVLDTVYGSPPIVDP